VPRNHEQQEWDEIEQEEQLKHLQNRKTYGIQIEVKERAAHPQSGIPHGIWNG
jgi:hypothetical protein